METVVHLHSTMHLLPTLWCDLTELVFSCEMYRSLRWCVCVNFPFIAFASQCSSQVERAVDAVLKELCGVAFGQIECRRDGLSK